MLGFLGVHGSLPLHYTETLARHERQTGDGGPRAWLDTLSQRALALFYQAWARYRIECQQDADGGDFLPLQLALAGAWPAEVAKRRMACQRMCWPITRPCCGIGPWRPT